MSDMPLHPETALQTLAGKRAKHLAFLLKKWLLDNNATLEVQGDGVDIAVQLIAKGQQAYRVATVKEDNYRCQPK